MHPSHWFGSVLSALIGGKVMPSRSLAVLRVRSRADHPIHRSPDLVPPSPPPIPIPDWRRFGRGNPKASQPGPVHARFSRGWAEIGVCFSDQASIGVGFADLLRVLLWLKVSCFSRSRA